MDIDCCPRDTARCALPILCEREDSPVKFGSTLAANLASSDWLVQMCWKRRDGRELPPPPRALHSGPCEMLNFPSGVPSQSDHGGSCWPSSIFFRRKAKNGLSSSVAHQMRNKFQEPLRHWKACILRCKQSFILANYREHHISPAVLHCPVGTVMMHPKRSQLHLDNMTAHLHISNRLHESA